VTTLQPQTLLWGGLIFASVFLGGLGARWAWIDLQRKRVQRRLQDLTKIEDQATIDPVIVRDLKLSSLPLLDRLLRQLRFVARLERLLMQADSQRSASSILFLMLALGGGGAFLSFEIARNIYMAPVVGFVLGSIPIVVLLLKKRKRIRRFEAQLPDALDLITGALRSGMAFNGALQLVAEESPDPIGKEFMIVFEEHRLGLPLPEALEKMTQRVDTHELQLFVAAVILQRETGGNLGEILEGSAEIIRDRFRILGDVRTITAQARLSGVILVCLPIVMAVMLSLVVPDYMKVLTADSLGRSILIGAVSLQFVGILAIRRIISIKV
jgi:tight adherence protein B